MKILIIEDDRDVAEFLQRGLRELGYTVDHAREGRDGLHLAREPQYDAIVMDRMLPGMDGLEILRNLRGEGLVTPVIILSALSSVDERIRGLKAGADDYVVKPYVLAELQARIEAVIRRRKPNTATTLRVDDLELDLVSRMAHRAGRPIALNPREFQLLEYLMRHAGQVITRSMLREAVWDYQFHPQTNTLDVHISRLRQKIEFPQENEILTTVRGVGYRLGHAR